MLDTATLVTQQGTGNGRGRVTSSFLGRNKKKNNNYSDLALFGINKKQTNISMHPKALYSWKLY